jgi:hypothetical protein
MNYQFVRLCRQYGITCKAFLMLGLPGETRETIAATERFIAESQVDDFQLSIYYPYRGTQIRTQLDAGSSAAYDLRLVKEGLGAYGQVGGSTEAVVRTGELSSKDLLEERDRLVRTYKPQSHRAKWGLPDDHFFDTHLCVGESL